MMRASSIVAGSVSGRSGHPMRRSLDESLTISEMASASASRDSMNAGGASSELGGPATTRPRAGEVGSVAFPDVCVAAPATTPPSTNLLTLRRGDRPLRITGWYSLPYNAPNRLAHKAIDRVSA
jgi:hypothetical protein